MKETGDKGEAFIMDWLDYRKALEIAYCDKEKLQYFTTKMFMWLEGYAECNPPAMISISEYMTFCNMTATPCDKSLLAEYCGIERYKACIFESKRRKEDFREFLAYYMAFINALDDKRGDLERTDFIGLLRNMLSQSHIAYELVEDNGDYFVFPKGDSQMDMALVSQPLAWLSQYPKGHAAYVKALKKYAEATAENASEVADQLRKALEAFMREFFGVEKNLENLKSVYGIYLKSHGIPSSISGNLETLLQAYTNFMNDCAKHDDKTQLNILEYILYQTGNSMRLLLALRQADSEKERG